MSLTNKDKRIAYSIVSHLQSQVDSKRLSEEQTEGVSVAIQCLSEAYHLDQDDKAKYEGGKTLEELFGEFKILTDEDRANAESLKQKGNAELKLNKFEEAISLYSKAIEIDSNNATFYCNRAAAYIKVENYPPALEDCKKAIQIDPGYARAHGRMGYIYSVMNQFKDAQEYFEKAIQLDPANASYRGNLDAVKEQMKNSPPQGGGAPASGAQGAGPGLGGLLGGGLGSLFQNPGFMNMATSMMQNPAFQNIQTLMRKYYRASRMMQQGGPNPQSMAEMMPEMVHAARQMQQENPELFENLRQQASELTPEGQPPSDGSNKDSDSKEQ